MLVISFTKFEGIESSKEYKDLEKLAMPLSKLRKGSSGYIKKIRSMLVEKCLLWGGEVV